MNDPMDGRNQYIDDNADFGGASAGAQNGGIVDAGAADNETEYSDSLAGRKGGSALSGTDEDYVGGGSFEDEEEMSGIGSLGDMDSVGTDRGMPGTWTGGTSTSNSSGL